MKHELSKEKIQWLHDACEEAAAAGIKLTMNPNELLIFTSALLAAHDQEPAGWIVHAHGGDQLTRDGGYVANAEGMHGIHSTPLYTHPAPSGTNQVDELVMWVKRLVHSLKKANPDSKLHLEAMDYLKRNALIGLTDVLRVAHPAPSIPTVSFYRDGIEAAAKWVDAQREAYDNEHGRTDPDTGSFEFGNDAQLEYSATLAEIAEGIRALHPNAASAPSIPAAVPEGYALVPVDATRAMIDAARRVEEDGYDAMHKAMIAAAPKGVLSE